MRRNLLAIILFLTTLSTCLSAEESLNDNFESQAAGQKLSDLVNWKFIEGWIKSEDGKVIAEKGNKFLRMHGDIFARGQFTLEDRLTFRFKIRATGSDEEVGGLCLRASDSKSRYDILLTYRQDGSVLLVQDVGGARDEISKSEGNVRTGAFQEVVVVIERATDGIQFRVSVDGKEVINKLEARALSLLTESFTAGFFTYNDKTVDIDDVVFTKGR